MKPETAARTIDKELDNFLTGLYSPLQAFARKHISQNEGRRVPDLEVSARKLQSLYKKTGKELDLEGTLARHGASLTLEATNLITALIWLQRGDGSEAPGTGYVEVGADRLFFAEDRKIDGITMTFSSDGDRPKLESVHTKEEAKVYAAFALEGKSINSSHKTWRLESGILQIADSRYKLVSTKGVNDAMSGQEFSVEVLKEGENAVVAKWEGNIRINDTLMNQRIGIKSLHGINSSSGRVRLDMDYTPRGAGYEFMAVRAAEPWYPIELSRFASERSVHGRGFFGVNLKRTEDTESIEGVSVEVDGYSANRAPGTYLKVDEYTAEFGPDGQVKTGVRNSKNLELKGMSLYAHTDADSDLPINVRADKTKFVFGRIFEPVISTIAEAKATE